VDSGGQMNKTALGLGRGTLYLMVVQVVFLASGYIINAGLGRLLGPASYGIFGVVIYLITISQDFLRVGIPQAASKYIAEDNSKAGAIKDKTVELQLIFSLLVFSVYLLFADIFADLLGDPSLSLYIRISAFVIPAGAFFALYTNFLNGLRWYDKQAIAMLFYSVAKITGVFTLVFFGYGIYGAIFGYLMGPLAGFALGWYFFKGSKRERDARNEFEKKIISFAMPVIIFSVTFTFLISDDLLFVKRILRENVLVGYYTAASMLSRIPFIILGALGFALFPAISRSTAINDVEQTENYISGSMRYLLMFLVPIILLVSATSKDLVSLFYSSAYLPAFLSLSILIFGLGFFTILSIMTTIITASGRPRVSMLIALVLVPLSIVFNMYLIPLYQLEGAALATTVTALLGVCFAAGYVFKRFKTLINAKSFLKICVASIFIYVIALRLSLPPVYLPVLYVFLFALYFCILFLMNELREEDLKAFKGIIRGRGG
jgi:stage V sporulation protein B